MEASGVKKLLARAVHDVAKDYAFALAPALALLWILPGWVRCCLMFLGALVFLASIIGPLIVDWKPREKVLAAGKAVLITGCDTGFGHMLAKKLDELGFHVFAGCLNETGEGAEKLRKSGSGRLRVFGLDVTKDESVEKAVDYVKNQLGDDSLWAVVCNAGINDGGELIWTSLATIQRVIDVNMYGVVRVTKAFLPQICKSKGRVVAVASAAGRYTYPGMVPYCMSKQAVVSFCDGLRMEMYKFGVQVVTIEPWMYRTDITNRDSIAHYLSRTWEQAPEEIKNLHEPNFSESYIDGVNRFINYSISSNTNEVVACLKEALTARYPNYSYSPGTLHSRFTFWFLRKLPKAMADTLILSTFGHHVSGRSS